MKTKTTAATNAATPLELLRRVLPPNTTIMGAKGFSDSVRQDVTLACRIDGAVYRITCSREGGQS